MILLNLFLILELTFNATITNSISWTQPLVLTRNEKFYFFIFPTLLSESFVLIQEYLKHSKKQKEKKYKKYHQHCLYFGINFLLVFKTYINNNMCVFSTNK